MPHYFQLLIGALLINNVVLTQFLGLCPLMGASRRIDTAFGLGAATLFVMIMATTATSTVDHLLLSPLGVSYLSTLVFIGLIATLVQATEVGLKAFSPRLYEAMGIYLPLITTNCAVLGVALITARKQLDALETFFFSLGSALGFVMILILFSAMRERLEQAEIPEAFRGAAIGLITAGIAAMAFNGFSGVIGT
jgi:Na+-translocating ferredoxin:NAD+ oxidoreductase subunit A